MKGPNCYFAIKKGTFRQKERFWYCYNLNVSKIHTGIQFKDGFF